MSENMKSNLELVQELLESKFNSLDEKVDDGLSNLNEKLDLNNKHVVELLSFIREQTTKTNGRVSTLENDVRTVTMESSQHIISCPRIKDIDNINRKIDIINEENFILKIWNKYPKQLLAFIVIIVILTLGSISYTVFEVHKALRDIKSENLVTSDTTYTH